MNNLESLKDIIENYSEELKHLPSSEIENFQALLEDIRNKLKSIWDLDIRDEEEYYFLSLDGDIVLAIFNADYDRDKREVGNAFLTKEEAEFERERRKIEVIMKKYSRPFKCEEENYCICYDYVYGSIEVRTNYTIVDRNPYFESEKVAEQVIDEIGKDRLKKYWFRVK